MGGTIDSKPVNSSGRPEGKIRNLAIVLAIMAVAAIAALIILFHRSKSPAAAAPPASEDARPAPVWTEPETGMEFVRIPAGEFEMGSNAWDDDEKPVHRVRLDAFWLGKTEVTQGPWEKVMGENPSYFRGSDLPVEQASWEDAGRFAAELGRRTGAIFRLPTEAEWEYACRAGSPDDRYGGLESIAWYEGNSGGRTHPAGEKRPNAFGLYDMLGNVWEWCADLYSASYYSISPKVNPRGPEAGSLRVSRGGSWSYGARDVRASDRSLNDPSLRGSSLGFRLVKED